MSNEEISDSGGGVALIAQLPSILWQRRWLVIVPAVLGIVASIGAAFLLPKVYRSSALMIVQSSQLPADVTGEGQSEIVDRRIARIRQQITSRPDLVSLIEKYGLYRKERASDPLSEIVEEMRNAISLVPTTADLPGNRSEQRTVAVRLSFDYPEAAQAQAVAQDLMQKMLELDSAGNALQASNTVQFLSDQAKVLEKQIADIQGQIAQINAQNGSILANSGITMVGNSAGSYDVQIAALQRDNATLLSQRDVASTSDTRDPAVVAAEAQLAAARAVYTEGHPDVVIAKQRLEEARELAKSNSRRPPLQSIDSQIAFNNSQIVALRAAKTREQSQVAATLSAQSRAPLVQQQISELQERLTGLNGQYKLVSDRLLAARAGVRAEDEQMAERLSVVEPPVLPDDPESPNRPKIMALGALGSLAAGFLLALLVELLLKPIRTPTALAAISGQAPLGIIPVIKPLEKATSRKWRPAFLKRSRYAEGQQGQ